MRRLQDIAILAGRVTECTNEVTSVLGPDSAPSCPVWSLWDDNSQCRGVMNSSARKRLSGSAAHGSIPDTKLGCCSWAW